MPFTIYKRRYSNPYKRPEHSHTATIFRPDDYHINLLASCGGTANTVVNIIAAHPVADSDLFRISKPEILRIASINPQTLKMALYVLQKHNILAKGPKLDDYYLNPALYGKITLLSKG